MKMNKLRHIFYIFFTLCLLASCVDDRLGFSDRELLEGETTLSLDASFTAFAEQNLSRAANSSVTDFNTLSDLVILVYDKDGKLKDIQEKAVSGAVDQPRDPSNTSTGSDLGENSTLSLSNIPLKLSFGEYYIVAVANLGTYNEENGVITTITSTYTVLTTEGSPLNEAVQTLDGIRNARFSWNDNALCNNRQLFGIFASTPDGGLSSSPNWDSSFSTVKVNRPNMKLHAWLRRCVSKITVDFDGSKLRENVYIRVREVRIRDLANTCTLGFGKKDETVYYNNGNAKKETDDVTIANGIDNSEALWQSEGSDISANNENLNMSSQIIPFYGDEANASSKSAWPTITSGTPYVVYDPITGAYEESDEKGDGDQSPHSAAAPALYFYENMQGKGGDRTTKPDLVGGGVVGADVITKDGMEFGTYIEVIADYHSDAEGNIADGPIIYRFMLGKDVKTDYNAERNYHYKLTLILRGNGNDYDWHIDFREEEGFDVPNPWFVSYLYNHDAMLPFKFIPAEGWTLTKMEAEIVTNPWYPSVLSDEDQLNPNAVIAPTPPADETDHSAFSGAPFDFNKLNGNGFLALQINQTDEEPALTDVVASGGHLFNNASDYWYTKYEKPENSINEPYFYGKATDGLNRSKRVYYFDGADDPTNQGRNAYSSYKDGEKITFNIPLFTRQKILVKQTGYSGNNPYVGYERTAKLKLTATLKNSKGETREIEDYVNVIQVRRIVNPKGVYRRFGNNEPFHAQMMWLDGAKTEFEPVISHGPWMAEIVGDENFITLDGKQRVSGPTNSPIDFTIKFNRMNTSNEVLNAIVRVRYHNYTCIHLIFVRQGYDAQRLRHNGVVWETRNMISANLMAEDPRDEGSMFKFGNSSQPIDAVNNAYKRGGVEFYTTPEDDEFKEDGPFYTVNDAGELSAGTTPWSSISSNANGFKFDYIANAATMTDFQKLYYWDGEGPNYVEFGYGVLYADGATETLTNINDAYGYYRRDPDNTVNSVTGHKTDSKKGMRGVFAYYYNNTSEGQTDPTQCHNIFFPIGRSGYGHRKNAKEDDNKNNGKGILRYAVRDAPSTKMSSVGPSFPYTAPLFVSLYNKNGAIYWAKETMAKNAYKQWNGEEGEGTGYGLDLNYFTFDVNAIVNTNVDNGNDAAFVRTVQR